MENGLEMGGKEGRNWRKESEKEGRNWKKESGKEGRNWRKERKKLRKRVEKFAYVRILL